jgi:phosphoribosylglycinamide formyltransferase-1
LKAGDKISGASVQIINETYDAGPVLLQKKVPVLSGDTIATLGERVRAVEARLYINALEQWQTGSFQHE